MIPFHYLTIHKYLFAALMMNEFETFDEDECGDHEICDPIDSMNLDFELWDNIAYAWMLTLGMGLMAALCLVKQSRKVRVKCN